MSRIESSSVGEIPALWNEMSMPPYASTAAANIASTSVLGCDVDSHEQPVDFLRDGASGGLVDVGAHDAGTVGGEAARAREADAAAGAGDDRDLAVEPVRHSRSKPRYRSQSVTAASNAASSTLAMLA